MTTFNTVASGSQHSMAYVPELAYGTTPATPAFKPLRHTGTTLALSKETIQSEELRADRQIAGFKHGNYQVGGDLNIEFSYGSFDDLLEALLCGTWATNVLKVGTERRSFTIERLFADIGQYHRFTGCEINTMSLSVAPNAMVTGSFGVIGSNMATDTAAVTGATYAAATTNVPFDSFSGVLEVDGVGNAVVTSIDLNLDNGIEPLFVVGDRAAYTSSIRRSNCSGSLSAYFDSADLVNKFINEDDVRLRFTLVGEGGSYDFVLPRIKFGSGAPEVSDDGPVILSMDWQALLGGAEATNLQITRAPAP